MADLFVRGVLPGGLEDAEPLGSFLDGTFKWAIVAIGLEEEDLFADGSAELEVLEYVFETGGLLRKIVGGVADVIGWLVAVGPAIEGLAPFGLDVATASSSESMSDP